MALPDGIPAISRVILHQRGAMRLREGTERWLPFTAAEQFGLNPPEFVWRARIRLGPLLGTSVQDEYLDGIGSLTARLWGVIPLVHPHPDPRLDEGALLRYLAEAVWFPVALLPSTQLPWRAAGSQSAAAILRDGATEARLTFHFNAAGEVVRIEALRPCLSGHDYLSRGWSGLFSEWREFCGMRIPTLGRVFWHVDTGRGSIGAAQSNR